MRQKAVIIWVIFLQIEAQKKDLSMHISVLDRNTELEKKYKRMQNTAKQMHLAKWYQIG